MNLKRAQSELITTVLIILLVLAAVVIVWQVVQGTIRTGERRIDEQTKCFGVELSLKNTSATEWVVRRSFSGGTFSDVNLVIVRNSETVTPTSSNLNGLKEPLGSGTFTLDNVAVTSLEVGLIGDGVACPLTAKWP